MSTFKRNIFLIFILSCFNIYAQNDSTAVKIDANLVRLMKLQNNLTERILRNENSYTDRKVHFRFIPGMGRNPDYGFSLGAGAAMSFYTSRTDSLLSRSNIPLQFSCTLKEPFSFKILSSPEFYFNGNRIKLSADIQYHKWLEYYYGVGYSTNRSISRERGINSYISRLFYFTPTFQVKIGDLSLYGGIKGSILHENIKDPGSFLISDYHYIESGGTQEGLKSTGIGLGPAITLDTRDNTYNSTEGVYFNLESLFYSTLLGGKAKYSTLTMDYRQYARLGSYKSILAWNVTSNNSFGSEIPFMRYATIGAIMPFRGYYGYQYRDKSILVTQVEYRYMFNIGGPWSILVNRFGFSLWGGLGFMGKNPIKYEAVLPEAGAGIKIKATRHAIFRFDCGYSTRDNRFLWYIGMSQSF